MKILWRKFNTFLGSFLFIGYFLCFFLYFLYYFFLCFFLYYFLGYFLLLICIYDQHHADYRVTKRTYSTEHKNHSFSRGEWIVIAIALGEFAATYFRFQFWLRATCVTSWTFYCICTIIFSSIIEFTVLIIRTFLIMIRAFIPTF